MAQTTLHPAINYEVVVPGGPYYNIENTGTYLEQCNWCAGPNNTMQAMCWDGSSPGVAFDDGSVIHVLTLPSGATDPDIVLLNDAIRAVVVYERAGGVYYKAIDITSGVPVMGPENLIRYDNRHPNIDVNMSDQIGVVFEYLKPNQLSPDQIKVYLGTLNSSNILIWSNFLFGDNKGAYPLLPQQNGNCMAPDIAMAGSSIGGNDFGCHVTFLENTCGIWNWHKMEWELSSTYNWQPPIYWTQYKPSSPRIAGDKLSVDFNSTKYEMVFADNGNTTNNHHVLGYNGVVPNNIWIDFPMFATGGSCYDAVVGWVEDDYINAAWSGFDPSLPPPASNFDIWVKRMHNNGTAWDGSWSMANKYTTGGQHNASIDGCDIGTGMYAYLWNDDNGSIWFKQVSAGSVLLKTLAKPEQDIIMEVFPNPVTDALGIFIPELSGNEVYYLYSLNGNLLASNNIMHNMNYIMVQDLPNGIYVLKIKQGTQIIKKKIVIQH